MILSKLELAFVHVLFLQVLFSKPLKRNCEKTLLQCVDFLDENFPSSDKRAISKSLSVLSSDWRKLKSKRSEKTRLIVD